MRRLALASAALLLAAGAADAAAAGRALHGRSRQGLSVGLGRPSAGQP